MCALYSDWDGVNPICINEVVPDTLLELVNMKLGYEERDPAERRIYPHWITHEVYQSADDMMAMMDVNQWCGETFGPVGDKWGYERTANIAAPGGSIKFNLRNPPSVTYSWRFKDKKDAMLFKLTWGGA